jgi:hypothetical protein
VKRSEIVEEEAVKLTIELKVQCDNLVEYLQVDRQILVEQAKKGASRTGFDQLEGLRCICQKGF